jgi:hypothetical protein
MCSTILVEKWQQHNQQQRLREVYQPMACTPPGYYTHTELNDALLLYRQYADQREEPCTAWAGEAIDDLHVTMPSHVAIHVDLLLKVVDVNNDRPAQVFATSPYLHLEQEPTKHSDWPKETPPTKAKHRRNLL